MVTQTEFCQHLLACHVWAEQSQARNWGIVMRQTRCTICSLANASRRLTDKPNTVSKFKCSEKYVVVKRLQEPTDHMRTWSCSVGGSGIATGCPERFHGVCLLQHEHWWQWLFPCTYMDKVFVVALALVTPSACCLKLLKAQRARNRVCQIAFSRWKNVA